MSKAPSTSLGLSHTALLGPSASTLVLGQQPLMLTLSCADTPTHGVMVMGPRNVGQMPYLTHEM